MMPKERAKLRYMYTIQVAALTLIYLDHLSDSEHIYLLRII